MKKSSIFLISIVGLFVLMVCLPKDFSSPKETFFKVERGEGSKDIAQNLEQDGLIWWKQIFRVYVLIRGTSDKMQAGIYKISPAMNILTIAEKFASGDIATQTVTIPEGFTAEQIWERLQVLPGYGKEADLAALEGFEGMLFPDTYQIPYGLELAKVITMMTGNFDKKTAGLIITSESIVMASILEKELKTKEDKEMASGVLWKRLRVGMPLQVDADMWTYQNRGLPEKPICNPGLNSIKAALYPKESSYWYYLSTPEGETIFSKTLEEHNIAKAKYLR